jgi:hypothetical protein
MIIYLPNSLTLDTAAVSYSFSFFFFFFSTQRNWVWTCKCVCVCVCVQFSITLLYILYMVHGTQFQLWRGLSIPNACFMPSFILMFLHQINKTKITFQPKPTQRDKTTSRKLPLLLFFFFIYLTWFLYHHHTHTHTLRSCSLVLCSSTGYDCCFLVWVLFYIQRKNCVVPPAPVFIF